MPELFAMSKKKTTLYVATSAPYPDFEDQCAVLPPPGLLQRSGLGQSGRTSV